MKTKHRCPTCAAPMVEYKFSLNKGIVAFLTKLHAAGGPVKTDDLGLTYSQRTNSQKARYWGLAEPYRNAESARKAGWWQLTAIGRDFVCNLLRVHKYVIMYRNQVVRFEGPIVKVGDIDEGYKFRRDYAETARPHGEDATPAML